MRRFESKAIFGLILVIGLTLQACGDSGEPPTPAKPAPAPEPAPEPPTAPVPEPVTPPVTEPATPPAGTDATASAGDAAAGKASYATFCAVCHGADGSGETPMSASLNPPPTAHSDGSYMNTLSDEYLFKVIKQGGMAVGKAPTMAPWGGTLSDDQIRDVIAFIRSLAVPPYTPPAP